MPEIWDKTPEIPGGETQSCLGHDRFWDAGDIGCGELVMQLRRRLRAAPRKVLKLVARDPGAPSDIPAYCRLPGINWFWKSRRLHPIGSKPGISRVIQSFRIGSSSQ
jgi:tRNA 2-thiouridine synthesizing protein A